MRILKRFGCLLGVFLQLLWSNASAQQTLHDPTLDTLVDHAAATLVKDGPWIGLSAAVVRDGHIYRYDYGTTKKEPTLYELGSITKTFTTLLLANAVLEKRVSLDDDIRLYLKGDYPNLQFNGQPVRLLHLVNLTSSLPGNLPDFSPLLKKISPDSIPAVIVRMNEHYEQEDFLNDLHKVRLDTVPGLISRHSNVAAQLLGFILENIYKTSYEELVKKYITGPLKMENTYVTVPQDKWGLLAKCYNDKGMPQPYIVRNAQASGGLKSCADDMSRYVAYQLDESNPAVRLTHQAVWGHPNSFALGMNWFIGTFEGRRRVRTDGTTFGFTSYCLLYPDLHFGIILMTNECAPNSRIQDKLYAIGDRIFEELYFSPAERSSAAFGFSPGIHALLAGLEKQGFDHAPEVAAGLKSADPTFNLDENEVNTWAYALLGRGEKQKALEIFKLNAALHPGSWNAFDSMAECYEDLGDTAAAITHYNRSLELNPKNSNAVEHLKKLKAANP